MDGVIAINELNDLSQKMSQGVKLMGRYGREWAEAERAYKVAVGEATLRRRDEGMPATLIGKVVGMDVAEACFKRDLAEALWKTAQENVNVTKLQARLLESQIAREWGQA